MRSSRGLRGTILRVVVALCTFAFVLAIVPLRTATPAKADDSQNVSIADAMAQAQQSGQPVLATAETTETSSVVANPDGTLTATLGAGPLQEPDPSSPTGWSPIDLTLEHEDGTYAPQVSAADTSFSDGGAGALASLSDGTKTYTEEWGSSLPTPEVSGTTATYPNVLPGIDLVMQAQTAGFKQSFLVKAPPSQQLTLDVPLSLRGLSATVAEDGTLIVTDAHGTTVATSGTAVMYGAAVDSSGEPTISATVDTAIVSVGGTPVFRITPDQSFFANPELTYPVTIDPSPNLDVSTDTYVKQSTPTTGYMSDNVLKVGSPDGSDVTRAFLKFDLSAIEGDGVDASSATLNLYQIDANTCTPTELDVYDATSNWVTLTGPTWSSQPTIGTIWASASAAYGHSGCGTGGWVNVSTGGASSHTLADLVMAWENGDEDNNGIALEAASESSSSYWKKFRSLEQGSNTPTLSVTYSTCHDEMIAQMEATLSSSPDTGISDGTSYGYPQSDESQPVACTNLNPGETDTFYGTHMRTFKGPNGMGNQDLCVKTEAINQADYGIHSGKIQGYERIDCNSVETFNWQDPYFGGWVELWRVDGGPVQVESSFSNLQCLNVTTCHKSTPWLGSPGGHTFYSYGHSQICFHGEYPNCRNYTDIFSYQVGF